MAVPNIFGSATSAIPLSQLDQNFATAITLGNTAVYLGNTTTSLGNVTLTNVTISSGTSNIAANVSTAVGLLPEAQGGTGTTTGYYGFKNRIINGAMVIDQRNAGASVTYDGSSGYSVDRFFASEIGNGAFTLQQVSTSSSADNAPAGFVNSLKMTVTTPQTGTLNAGLSQAIEGYNIADLNWGTANAASVTLSFWVKSSVTGAMGGSIQNSAGDRSYPFNYTVNTANTWEQKSITIAGDTSGTWLTTNGTGLLLRFMYGTSSTGAANTWAAANYRAPTGSVFPITTSGATFFITGVQLEKGSTATSFDYRPYGTELQLCQRYLPALASGGGSVAAGYSYTTTNAILTVNFPSYARVQPTGITTTGSFSILNGSALPYTVTTLVFSNGGSSSNCEIVATIGTANFTIGQGTQLRTSGTASILFTGCEL